MAQQPSVSSVSVKQQGLWALIGLAIITLGIYLFFWYYRVNREMKETGAALGDAELGQLRPGIAVLALFIPIANIVTFHRCGRRVLQLQQAAGRPADYSMLVHWILFLFTGLWFLYTQSALNQVWINNADTPRNTAA